MSVVQMTEQDGVTVVALADGKANTFGRAMVQELTAAARTLAEGRGGVVLTGGGRFFSAGLDLDTVLAMDREALGVFVDAFEEMGLAWFGLGRPVVAAVNGFAIAGGMVIALTADAIVMTKSESCRMGLSEVPLGIALPTLVTELIRHQLSPAMTMRVALEGALFDPDEALRTGIVRGLSEPDALLPDALALATKLASSPGEAYRLTKLNLRRDTLERMRSLKRHGRDPFLDSFMDERVRSHIQKTLESMRGKKGGGR